MKNGFSLVELMTVMGTGLQVKLLFVGNLSVVRPLAAVACLPLLLAGLFLVSSLRRLLFAEVQLLQLPV